MLLPAVIISLLTVVFSKTCPKVHVSGGANKSRDVGQNIDVCSFPPNLPARSQAVQWCFSLYMFIEIRSHGLKVDGQKLGTLLILLGTPARASYVVCTSMQVNAAQELQASVISDIKNMVSVIFSKTACHGFRTLFIQFFSINSLALTDTMCFLSVHCTPDSSFWVNKPPLEKKMWA